jgi:hypothetical protein
MTQIVDSKIKPMVQELVNTGLTNKHIHEKLRTVHNIEIGFSTLTARILSIAPNAPECAPSPARSEKVHY